MSLRYQLSMSRQKWLTQTAPMHQEIDSILNLLPNYELPPRAPSPVKLCMGARKLEDLWRVQSQMHCPTELDAHLLKGPIANGRAPNLPKVDLTGVYAPILKNLYLQLCTLGVRNAMRWFALKQPRYRGVSGSPVNVGELCFILKIGRDGFVTAAQRRMILSIATNCNVTGFCNSTFNTDIVILANEDEAAYTLHLLAQELDKEIFLLRLFGAPDPKTGKLLLFIVYNCEDTGSLEKSLGRAPANSNGRFIWSKWGKHHHIILWRKYCTPLGINGKWARTQWESLVRDKLLTRCRLAEITPYLSQFNSAERGDWEAKEHHYKRIRALIKSNYQDYGFTQGDWLRAEDVESLGMCGLHLELNTTNIVAKYIMLHSMRYHLWITDPAQSQTRRLNHGTTHLRRFEKAAIKKHFAVCCKIPMMWDASDSSMSNINLRMFILSFTRVCSYRSFIILCFLDGNLRRRFIKLWARLIHCPTCHWRPFAGSALEGHFAHLLILFVDVLIPFQLTYPPTFMSYYRHFVVPKHRIPTNDPTSRHSHYLASTWKIYAEHFRILLMELLGPNRMTRYFHALLSCGEHWMDQAFFFRETPRNLFANDGNEACNDVVKVELRHCTGKFGGIVGSVGTLKRTVRKLTWTRYDRRELSEHRSCAALQDQRLEQSRLSDLKLLQNSNISRNFFIQHHIGWIPGYNHLATNVSHCSMYDSLVDECEREELHNAGFLSDPELESPDEIALLSDWECDIVDLPESTDADLLPQSHGDGGDTILDIDSVQSIFVACNQRTAVQPDSINEVGSWQDVNLHSPPVPRVFLGRNIIAVEGSFPDQTSNHNNDYCRLKLTWSYKQLFALRVGHIAHLRSLNMYFKFVSRPKIYDKNSAVSNTWRLTAACDTKLQMLIANIAKLRIQLTYSEDLWPTICASICDHPTLKREQYVIDYNVWVQMSDGYDSSEASAAEALWTNLSDPVFSSHSAIDECIIKQLHEITSEGKTKICVECKQPIFALKKHCVCIDERESPANLSNNITRRISPESERKLEYIPKEDPYCIDHNCPHYLTVTQNQLDCAHVCLSQLVLDSAPHIWSPYVLLVHSRMVKWFTQFRSVDCRRVRVDKDWQTYLRVWCKDLAHEMNLAMIEVLHSAKTVPHIADERSFVFALFAALSGIFKLDLMLCHRIQDASRYNGAELRQRIISAHQDCGYLYWAIHLVEPERLCAADVTMAQWGARYHRCFIEEWTCWTVWRSKEETDYLNDDESFSDQMSTDDDYNDL